MTRSRSRGAEYGSVTQTQLEIRTHTGYLGIYDTSYIARVSNRLVYSNSDGGYEMTGLN